MHSLNRRRLLKGAAAAFSLSALKASGMQHLAAAPPYRVALIGSGWYGKSDLFKLIQVAPVEVVALADVDKHMLAEAAALVAQRQASKKEPKQYTDYRKLLAENKVDIVLIGSPDHWHALQAIDAIKAGAHVYLQKPISVDVLEGEAIVAAARKYNRVVQIGTQRRSTPHLVEAKEKIIDSGLLGKVHHVEMCCYYHMRNGSNPSVQPVPAFLDYALYTGPAPLRPYDGLPHRGWWRAFMAYGNGIVGDMCVHMFDATRWMLGLGWPQSISSHGGIYVDKAAKSDISDTQHAVFAYDDLNCVWQHRSWGPPADPEYPWAYILYGEKGTLKCSVYKYEFIPNGKGEKLSGTPLYEKEQYPEDLKEKDIELHTASATRRHMRNFIQCIEKGGRPVADVAEGHISTASCILANISMQLGGRPLVYDPVKKIVVNDAEATALLARKYREGYTHPYKAIS